VDVKMLCDLLSKLFRMEKTKEHVAREAGNDWYFFLWNMFIVTYL
jgi:hypothetical protein